MIMISYDWKHFSRNENQMKAYNNKEVAGQLYDVEYIQ